MILNNETVLQILQQYERENHVQPSPGTGHLRIADMNNDVTCAIEKMGGIENACRLLEATPDEIDTWIDEHYVPEPFASLVRKHTGYSIWTLQEPTFYVTDHGKYWPHTPTQEQLTRLQGLGIYRRHTNAAQSPSGR